MQYELCRVDATGGTLLSLAGWLTAYAINWRLARIFIFWNRFPFVLLFFGNSLFMVGLFFDNLILDWAQEEEFQDARGALAKYRFREAMGIFTEWDLFSALESGNEE